MLGILILLAGFATVEGKDEPIPTGLLVIAGPEEPGTPLTVRGTVRDAEGRPVEGAEILVFHTDQRGWYTKEEVMRERDARLKGRVLTGPDGRYEIRTIRPGAYPAREGTPESRRIPQHIHYEVTAPGHDLERFQLVFEDDPRMTAYWREWARRGNHPITSVEQNEDGSLSCTCDVRMER